MTRSVLAALSALLLFPAITLSAQTAADREYHSRVQVSFIPPLSTNGLHSSRYTNDFSFNLLAGVSQNERAFAFGGLANVILNDARGFQFAGLSNYTGGEGEGLQFGGLANIVRGDFDGFQFGGLLNTANEMEGFQFGGLANIAGDVDGFQFGGLFNAARNVKGAQFAGLVNIAHKSDYPVGLVNIIRDGEMGIGVGYNETGTASLTLRSGGRVLYGILGVGYNHKVEKSGDAISALGGYGAHINILEWFRINNEFTIESIDCFSSENDGSTFKAGYALLPAFRLGHFEIFGGPNINYMQTKDPGMYDLFPKNSLWDKQSDSGMLQKLFIGYQVGVQVIF